MFQIVFWLCLIFNFGYATVEPDLNAMTLPPDFQSYAYQTYLSMEDSAPWNFWNSAFKINTTAFQMANNSFGFGRVWDILGSDFLNFRIELDITATYSATVCESFGVLIYNDSTLPTLSRTSDVNYISSNSGLFLFQQLCQYGTLRASFSNSVDYSARAVPSLGTTLATPCAKCRSVTSKANSANFKMIIQVVNQHLTVS